MAGDRYQRIREVLQAAGRLTGAERDAFLDRECGDDAALREEVERLLATRGVATDDLMVPLGGPKLPDALGPYRLERELGRGGMGVVYAAIDTRDGQRVALKVVHPHLSVVPRFLDRFEREARAGQKVDHRNVVRTLAVDRFDVRGQAIHFLAMEYVDGRDLRALADELGTVPESLLREIARQVAGGLAAVHAAGIVHRDVKPENILITSDQRVRLMDLGVARLDDASVALTHEGQFIGSLHYASPEQCEGREAGPASDLYSLGVVLYELATGTNPFRHESPGASIKAHLDTPPPPAHDVSPFFAALLATLLAKEPAARFPTGRHLAAVLDEGETGRWWVERDRARTAAQRGLPQVGVRKDTALVGRTEELALLRDAWQSACAGRGRTVLIDGEAGLGKTRLVDSFLQGLDGAACHALYGSFPPGGGLSGLSESILDKFGHAGLEEALGPYLGVTSALLPSFAALVRHEALPGELASGAVPAMCCHLMRALAAEKPTVWVLDDLHFAPELAHDIAIAMARAAAPHRVLLVLTARGLSKQELQRFHGTGVQRIELDRLADSQVAEMLAEAIGDEPSQTEQLIRKAGGIPMFALELSRAARTQDADELPSAVLDIIASRLQAVDKGERAVLEVGAVQGFEFDPDLCAAVLDRPVVTILQDLADVERRLGLVRTAGRAYRFDHHLVQQVMYAELPERLREEYHTRVAHVRPDAGSLQLATHLIRGVQPSDALPHVIAALKDLESQYLHEEAVELIDRALALDLDDLDRVRYLLRKANRLDLLGRRPEHGDACEQATQIANRTGDDAARSRAHRALGHYYVYMGRDQDALDTFQIARDCALAADDRAELVDCARSIGNVLGRMRRDPEALEWHQSALEMAQEQEDWLQEAYAAVNLGVIHRHLGEFENALKWFQEALDISDFQGERRLLGYCYGNLGSALWWKGDLDEALHYLELHLKNSIEIGERRGEAGAHCNIGLVYRDLGRCVEAKEHQERYLALTREVGDRRAEATAHLNLGSLAGSLGEIDDGRRHFEASVARARELGVAHAVGRGLVALGNNALQAGRYEDAERHYEEGLAAMPGDREGLWRVHYGRGRLAYARQDFEEAEKELRAAVELGAEIGLPPLELQPAGYLAATTKAPADIEALTGLLAKLGGRTSRFHRMEASFLLWQATGDREALAEARRILDNIRDHAPPRFREAMVANVPLHRQISDAR